MISADLLTFQPFINSTIFGPDGELKAVRDLLKRIDSPIGDPCDKGLTRWAYERSDITVTDKEGEMEGYNKF